MFRKIYVIFDNFENVDWNISFTPSVVFVICYPLYLLL
jgi:hypothetical protein